MRRDENEKQKFVVRRTITEDCSGAKAKVMFRSKHVIVCNYNSVHLK